MTTCHLCGGEGRVYSCWDEARCPMAQDGGSGVEVRSGLQRIWVLS